MSLSAREQEALDRIAVRIASSDSNLAALLDTFTRLTSGEQMPDGEVVRRAGRWARRTRRRTGPLPQGGPSAPLRQGGPPAPLRQGGPPAPLRQGGPPAGLAWLSAVVVLAVTALTVALAGGNEGACAHMRGLACAGQVTGHPRHPG